MVKDVRLKELVIQIILNYKIIVSYKTLFKNTGIKQLLNNKNN